MKKLYAMILAIVMVLTAANVAVLDNSKVTGYNIRNNAENYLEIGFSVSGLTYEEKQTEKGIFTELRIEDGFLTDEVGHPALPEFHEMIAMPYGAEPYAEVISYKTKVYKLSDLGIAKPVIPAQPSYSKSSKPEERLFVYNEDAYRTSKHSGKPQVMVEKSGTMRGVGVGRLEVCPFSYNAEEGTIEVYNDIQVRVNFIGAVSYAREIAAEEYSPYFESSYYSLINYKHYYGEMKADPTIYPVTYLILANNNLNGNADLNNFIAWKTQKGFKVIVNYVSSTSTITTNDTWIENQYSSLSPKPSFVLVVGDHDGTYGVLAEVNPSLGNINTSWYVTRSDLLYGVIGATSTSNYIASMHLGRMSVRALGDLTAQVNKTIWYEKNQFDTVLNPGQDFTYLTRPLGVAGYDGSYANSHGNPQINYGWDHYFNSTNGMGNAVRYLYPDTGNSTTDTAIINHMKPGANFYNYTAHGNETSFQDPLYSISSIDAMTNAGKYPLVVGNCCLTGSFGTTESFGEAWLNAPDKGAIGYIGASMSTAWNEDLAMGVGTASVAGTQNPPLSQNEPGMYDGNMMKNYPSQASVRFVGLEAVNRYGGYNKQYWSAYHLFGDPSLMPYFGIPAAMTASHDGVIAPGATTFAVTTTPYAYVAMGDQNGVLHGAARANSSGYANVTVTPYTVGDTGKMVITAQFKKPYFEDVLCTGDTGGTFAVNQSSLSYGNVDAGSTSVQQFIITNSHSTEYLMGDITTPTGYSVAMAAKSIAKYVKNTLSYSVAPQSSKTFDLTFAPTAGQTYSGDVTITSSDTGNSTSYISVTGTGIVPDISAPAGLSASTPPGSSTMNNFSIENNGQGTLDYNLSINYTSGKEYKGSGGPDTYGYKWKDSDETDGPVYSWVDITGVGTSVSLGDDALSAALNLGFTFNFYGTDFTSVKICSNGFLSFTTTSTAYSNAAIPTSAEPNNLLALIWDDLDPTAAGSIYYYSDTANNRFIVSYVGVPHFNTSSYNTAQVILYKSGKIVYQYQTVGSSTVSTATVGIENSTGSVGTQIVYNAAYLKSNLAIQFTAMPEWLTLSKTSGSVLGLSSDGITATYDAIDLDYGTYTADVTITSNDPETPSVVVPVTFIVTDVVTPEAPTNVTTGISGSDLTISWTAVSGATSYDVYSADDPYGTFSFAANVTTNSYTTTYSAAKKFWYVVAKN
jgi:hypothetical protein